MNPFIKMYDEQRQIGKSTLNSYVFASGKLAFKNGTNNQLQELYFHYVKDAANTFVDEMEEMNDEKI